MTNCVLLKHMAASAHSTKQDMLFMLFYALIAISCQGTYNMLVDMISY